MDQVSASQYDFSTNHIKGVDLDACELPEDFEAIYREHFRFVWRTAKRLGVAERFIDDVRFEYLLCKSFTHLFHLL